jgi:hypothetical protein
VVQLTERANSARVGLISKAIDFARLTRGALTKSVHIIGGGLAGCEAAWADDRKVVSRHR